MSLIHLFTRKGFLAACFFLVAPGWLAAQSEEEEPSGERLLAPQTPGSDMVDRIVFRDETTDQVLDLLERLTGRSIIRPQALPAATFTFNSQKPMTREEAILALESMLTINGIGVTPLGDLFLKVVPLAQLRTQAPEFLNESSLNLPASGRVVSRMINLEFLSLEEIQTQLNLMITSGSGSIIPFPKANSMLITDTVSNLQAIEELLAVVDRPFTASTETRFFPIRYARAEELIAQIESLAGVAGNPELSGRTILTADERSNQIILVTDARQMDRFATLIEKLDVQAELQTQNEVIFLKHADAVEVSSILSQLATGASGGAGSSSRSGSGGSSARPGGLSNSRSGQSGLRSSQGSRSSSRTNQRQPQQRPTTPQVPQLPGVRAQQAEEGGGAESSLGAAESALGEVAATIGESDFSETLTILPDERSNAIIISGTRQDISLISSLIEKIDIILAQVRIEVFIAEVSLSDTDGRGIERLGISFNEKLEDVDFDLQMPGFTLSRADFQWEALFTAAKTQSDVEILSTPTLVTTHNKEARFLVGESRPVITGTIADGSFSGGTIRSQVQQQDIAIELIVKPLIGNDGTIQLEIFQKVDDLGEDVVEVDGNEQPVIIRREAESFVSVSDGEIVILGGLQRSRKGTSKGRLGILGDIPLLGNLFTSSNKTSVRQELLVFIRPTVLPTTRDAHEDAQRQIGKQTREPYIRHQMDPATYPDPEEPAAPEGSGLLQRVGAPREGAPPPRAEERVAPSPEALPPAPAPRAPEPVFERERAPERETVEPEPRRPVRRGTGAGGRL